MIERLDRGLQIRLMWVRLPSHPPSMKSYTKKDFKVEWYSGQGAGGQKRNKTQCCCRITHLETGLRAQGADHATRPANQRDAFHRLVRLMIAKEAAESTRRTTSEVIRNYHGARNEVLDKASGLRLPYKQVVEGPDIGPMIEARRLHCE